MDFHRRHLRARLYELPTGFNVTVMEGFSKFIAEALGTAFLMFGGCMGCITWKEPQANFFSFGLVVMILIQCYGHISGAHFNPAVTVAAVVFRAISIPVSLTNSSEMHCWTFFEYFFFSSEKYFQFWSVFHKIVFASLFQMAILYFFAQIFGATIGYRFLVALTPVKALAQSAGANGFCTTAPHEDLNEVEVFVIEYIATTVLISICCAVWDPKNSKYQDSTAIKFGLAIAVLSFIFVSFDFYSLLFNSQRIRTYWLLSIKLLFVENTLRKTLLFYNV